MMARTWEELLAELRKKEERAKLGGGLEKQRTQKEKGKLLCRERIDSLVDPGSFVEINMLVQTQTFEFDMQQKKILGDGVVTGFALIDDRQVFVFSQDVTVFGGSAGRSHGEKINYLFRMAAKVGVPIIGLFESGGGRLQDGFQNESGYGQMFYENTRCSGVIPQIAAIMGACTGGGVYGPALMDFIIQVEKTAQMFITGPAVIEEVTGEKVDFEQLGGTAVHSQESGVIHLVAKNDVHCVKSIRRLLSYLPQNNKERSPVYECRDDQFRSNKVLMDIVPTDPRKTYDIRSVVLEVMDNSDFLEIQALFAPNIVIGFSRLNGQAVGVIANQPRYKGGTIDVNAADKAARFIRFCDCFNIPLIMFTDVPGYLPGVDQEKKGIIRHGAKMLYAFCEASVPKISCVLRKSYGGSIPAMCCHETGADFMFAWPTAEFAMMGAEAAVNILYKKEIKESNDPDRVRKEKIREYKENILAPYYAASKQYIDAVIRPEDTRRWLIHALSVLKDKRLDRSIWKKHGNIPL
jgi:acetyl-CoA carboxylase carboxyltransferase component